MQYNELALHKCTPQTQQRQWLTSGVRRSLDKYEEPKEIRIKLDECRKR